MIATLPDGTKIELKIEGVEMRCTYHGQHAEDGDRVLVLSGRLVLPGRTRAEKNEAQRAALSAEVKAVSR